MKLLRYLIPLLLAGGLLWFVFKDIDLASMMNRMAHADWRWIAVSSALTLLAHWFRAWRWQMLLRPLGFTPTVYESFISLLTGYFANYILPRMGEVTRCGTLYKVTKIPVNQSLGTVVAERIFDVITLLVLMVLNFMLEFDRLNAFFTDLAGDRFAGGNSYWLPALLLGALTVVGLIAVYIARNPSLQAKLLSNGPVAKIALFIKGMISGLLSVRNLESPLLFIASTVAIWVCYFFSSYVLFFCIPETSGLGLLAGLTLLAIGAVGMTAPTQGGIGAYHLLVGNVMILYGLTQQDGITLATFVHGTQMLLMLGAGAVAFLLVLLQKDRSAKPEAIVRE